MTVFDDGFAKKSEGLHAAKVLGFYEHLRTYIYGKSLCIESLHDRVHRVALDSLGTITLHCRSRFARKTLSARASSCMQHPQALFVS